MGITASASARSTDLNRSDTVTFLVITRRWCTLSGSPSYRMSEMSMQLSAFESFRSMSSSGFIVFLLDVYVVIRPLESWTADGAVVGAHPPDVTEFTHYFSSTYSDFAHFSKFRGQERSE